MQNRPANHLSRRAFLAQTGAAAMAVPWIVPASALGAGPRPAPSERLTLGIIGLGDRGMTDLQHFLQQADVQCVLVCDCFKERREKAKNLVDKYYGNTNCVATRYHEEVLEREDIDVALIVTGDRWHTLLSTLAARAGKDVYCEKPFSMTIGEGRSLVNTMQRYGAIWQCGTQRRSNESFRFMVDAVHKGMIGRIHTIRTSLGGWHNNGVAIPEPEPDPEVFDYDRWLGPSPWAPYSPVRVQLWRNHWDTGGGMIPDMGAHYFDITQWGNNTELTGPVEYEGSGEGPTDGFSNVPFKLKVEAKYANGVKLIVLSSDQREVCFTGDEGWINCTDEGVISAEPASILKERDIPQVNEQHTGGHVRNFLDCVKSRRLTVSNPELAHRAHTIVHCANLAIRLNRKLQWDPETERFINDDNANAMLTRTMRAPWRL